MGAVGGGSIDLPQMDTNNANVPFGQKTSYTAYFSRVQSPFADRTTVAAYTCPLTTVQNAPECDLRLDLPFDDELWVYLQYGLQIAEQADLLEFETIQQYVSSNQSPVPDAVAA